MYIKQKSLLMINFSYEFKNNNKSMQLLMIINYKQLVKYLFAIIKLHIKLDAYIYILDYNI